MEVHFWRRDLLVAHRVVMLRRKAVSVTSGRRRILLVDDSELTLKIRRTVELTVDLVELADVRVRHLRRDLRFADHHLPEARIAGEVRQDLLDDDQLLEAGGT